MAKMNNRIQYVCFTGHSARLVSHKPSTQSERNLFQVIEHWSRTVRDIHCRFYFASALSVNSHTHSEHLAKMAINSVAEVS